MINNFYFCSGLVLILAQTICTSCHQEDRQSKRLWLPLDVVVVGAGISGLAAARKLSSDKSNFTVKVFEAAKHRYGGRVWTDKLKYPKSRGIEVDFGASAFNVLSKKNKLVELAEDNELQIESLGTMQFFQPWKNKVYSGKELGEITNEAAEIIGQALNFSKTSQQELSIKEAVDKILIKKTNSAASYMVKCLPSYILKDYSAKYYQPENLDVGFEKVLLDGMGELIDRLLSGSMSQSPLHLHLNKAVRQIKIDEDKKKVLIRATDGSQTVADVVVVAVPVSVLSTGGLLFEPNLPKQLRLAASEISTSLGEKIIVEFENMFWTDDFGVFVRAVETDKERGFLQSWLNLHRLIKKPVLVSFVLGDAVETLSSLTDQQLQVRVINTLSEMFGSEAVEVGGKIIRLERSTWTKDQWAKGASTYPKVGSNPSLWNIFAEPICPYLYFVGEHTQFEDHGTLHGAYNSGIRAAEQLMNGHCQKKMEEERIQKETERKVKNESLVTEENDDDIDNENKNKDEL